MTLEAPPEGLPPLARPDARILVLGSFPSVQSLARREYYANPRNQFWRIMGQLFAFDPALAYVERCQRLLDASIALWDVCRSAQRAGSLDAAIDPNSVVANDLMPFLRAHTRMQRVLVNGQKAATLLDRLGLEHPLLRGRHVLPSTSPAHAAVPLDDKVRIWSIIRKPPQ